MSAGRSLAVTQEVFYFPRAGRPRHIKVTKVTVRAPSEGRILASAGFRQARLRAASTSQSVEAMRALLAAAENPQTVATWAMTPATQLHLDILCAIVDATMENLHPVAKVPAEAVAITAAARLALVIATLLYVTSTTEFEACSRPSGEEISALLRWASRAVSSELPVW